MKLRVLVVDDEAAIRAEIEEALQEAGFETRAAADGKAAAELALATSFDICLSDIRMPSMNGVELLEWMAGHRPELLQKTVFMTGDGRASALTPKVEMAGQPVLRKPFTLDALLQAATGILAPQP